MTLGHHGFWSLTPIFLFSFAGLFRLLPRAGKLLAVCACLTFLAIAGLVGYYLYDPAAWAYGGPLHHLFWLFWLIPALMALLGLVSWFLVVRPGGEPCWPSPG